MLRVPELRQHQRLFVERKPRDSIHPGGGPAWNDARMAKHEVKLRVNQGIDIENVDATLSVWSDDSLLGRLRVSRGSVDWEPAHGRQTIYRVSWEKFAELMVDNGRKRKTF